MGMKHESVAEAIAPTTVEESSDSSAVSSDFDGIKFRLCLRAQAGSRCCWTPSLKRRVANPARSGLDVLEVYLDLPSARVGQILRDEFGMLMGGSDA